MTGNLLSAFFSTDTLMVFRGIIPCLVIVFIGYMIGRVDRAEHEKTLSSLIYYVFSPSLVFSGIHRHAFRYSEVAALALAAVVTVLLLLPLAFAVKRKKHTSGQGYLLPMLFTSSGTLLMPLAYLLYGNEGLAKAAMFHLFSSLMFNTFGLRLAEGRMLPARFFKTPTVGAAVIALLSVELNIPLPQGLDAFFHLVERGIDIVGFGAIPILCLSFGYPFCRVSISSLKKELYGGYVRMIAGPIAAFLIVLLLRELGLLSTIKGYNVLEYIDKRTTEAVIILAGALPGAISCYLVTGNNHPDAAKDSLAMLMTGSILGILTIPCTILMINRFILAG